MSMVVEISEWPRTAWISFMFIADSHSLVAKVCLRLWLLKLGKRTDGSSLFRNSASLQSRIIRLYTLFSIPWVCRPPKRLRKTKSVYPSIEISQVTLNCSCKTFYITLLSHQEQDRNRNRDNYTTSVELGEVKVDIFFL